MLATQLWEIDPRQTSLDVFEGTYSQRREERQRLSERQTSPSAALQDVAGRTSTSSTRQAVEAVKVERQRMARLQELENEIAVLERELAALGARLENPPSDPARVAQLGREYARVQQARDALLTEWETLA